MPTTNYPGPGFLLQVDDGTGSAGRSVGDLSTITGATEVTSAAAAFVAGDVGRSVTAAGVPSNATIQSIQTATVATAWTATTAKGIGAVVIPTVPNTHIYVATVAGTTSGTQPTWPTTAGTTVVDGTVTWTCMATGVTAANLTYAATATAAPVAAAFGPRTGVFSTITAAKDIKALGLTVDTTDITNQSSAGGYEEVAPTIRRSGDTTFDLIFNPYDPTHDANTGLQYIMNNKLLRNYQMLIPGTTPGALVPAWTAFVVGFDINAPVVGVLAATVKLKVTGQPVWKVAG